MYRVGGVDVEGSADLSMVGDTFLSKSLRLYFSSDRMWLVTFLPQPVADPPTRFPRTEYVKDATTH